jgi:hypothetical protein
MLVSSLKDGLISANVSRLTKQALAIAVITGTDSCPTLACRSSARCLPPPVRSAPRPSSRPASIDQGAIIPDEAATTPHFLVWDNCARRPRFAPEPIWPPLRAVSSGRLRPMKLRGQRRRWQ